MKKRLGIVLTIVLAIGAVWAGACCGKTVTREAERNAEKVTVEAGIEALMKDNGLTDLSKYSDNTSTGYPVRTYEAGEATNDMTVFPSSVWHLYPDHMRLATLEYFYTVENDGTVRQFGDAAKTVEYRERELTIEQKRMREKAIVMDDVRTLMMAESLSDLSEYADGTPTGAPVRTYEAGEATNDMTVFPSAVWHLYPDHIRVATLEYYYTVENDGTVRQFSDAAKTVEYKDGE